MIKLRLKATALLNRKCALCNRALDPDGNWDGYNWYFGGTYHSFCETCEADFPELFTNCSCGVSFLTNLFNAPYETICSFFEKPANVLLNWNTLRWGAVKQKGENYPKQCPVCYLKGKKTCKFCGSISETEVCSSCKAHVFVCSHCNTEQLKAHPFEPDVCAKCAPHIYKIKEWNYKAPVIFWKTPKERTNLFYGLEIEVRLTADESWEKWVHRLWAPVKGSHRKFYFKWDGTVMPGFELVFQPMTWNYIKTKLNLDWLFAMDKYRDANYTSQGFHIHLSRKAFTPLHTFKFSNFVYANLSFMSILAGREPTKYCSTSLDIPLSQAVRSEVGCAKLGGPNVDLYNFKRRRWVNHINKGTIELRGFKTNLNPDRFWAQFEFADALYYFSKISSMRQLTFPKFQVYVQENAVRYPYLSLFMDRYCRGRLPSHPYTPVDKIYLPKEEN